MLHLSWMQSTFGLNFVQWFSWRGNILQVKVKIRFFRNLYERKVQVYEMLVTYIIWHNRLCYGKNFGPKGYGFGGTGAVPALMSDGIGQYAEERVQ